MQRFHVSSNQVLKQLSTDSLPDSRLGNGYSDWLISNMHTFVRIYLYLSVSRLAQPLLAISIKVFAALGELLCLHYRSTEDRLCAI